MPLGQTKRSRRDPLDATAPGIRRVLRCRTRARAGAGAGAGSGRWLRCRTQLAGGHPSATAGLCGPETRETIGERYPDWNIDLSALNDYLNGQAEPELIVPHRQFATLDV